MVVGGLKEDGEAERAERRSFFSSHFFTELFDLKASEAQTESTVSSFNRIPSVMRHLIPVNAIFCVQTNHKAKRQRLMDADWIQSYRKRRPRWTR